jgi:uncharacterized membrane protein HdeD (DUF308 family)
MTHQLRRAAFDPWQNVTLFGGITAIILGLVLLIWPGQTLAVFAALLGVALILIGIARLANAAVARDVAGRSRIWRILTGLLYIVAGIVVLANLHGTLRFLVVAVGLIWLIGGLVEIAGGFGRPRGDKSATIVIGVFNLCFGALLLFWPEVSLVFLIWIAALWLILIGLLQIVFVYVAKKAFKDADAAALDQR